MSRGDAAVCPGCPASKRACSATQPGCCLQGAKVLVVGTAPSFFTIFPVITGLGLKALQLDRAGALEPGSEQLQRAAAAAAEAADCLLVTEQQLLGALFPLNRQAFSHQLGKHPRWARCWTHVASRGQAMPTNCTHMGTHCRCRFQALVFYGSTSAPNPILQEAARSAGISQYIIQVPLPDLKVAVRAVKPTATASAASRQYEASARQPGQLEGQQQQALQAGTAAPAAHHRGQANLQHLAAGGHVSKPAGQLASGVFAAGQVHVLQTSQHVWCWQR